MVYIEDTVRKHNDLVGCSRMNGSATCSGYFFAGWVDRQEAFRCRKQEVKK